MLFSIEKRVQFQPRTFDDFQKTEYYLPFSSRYRAEQIFRALNANNADIWEEYSAKTDASESTDEKNELMFEEVVGNFCSFRVRVTYKRKELEENEIDDLGKNEERESINQNDSLRNSAEVLELHHTALYIFLAVYSVDDKYEAWRSPPLSLRSIHILQTGQRGLLGRVLGLSLTILEEVSLGENLQPFHPEAPRIGLESSF